MEPKNNAKMEEHVNMREECEREGRSTSYVQTIEYQGTNTPTNEDQDINTEHPTDMSDKDQDKFSDRKIVQDVLKLVARMPKIPYIKKIWHHQTYQKIIICTPNLKDDISLCQFECQLMKKEYSVDKDNGEPRVNEPTSISNITFVGLCHGAKVYRCVQGRHAYVFIRPRTPYGNYETSVLNLCQHLRKVAEEIKITENSNVAGSNTTKTEFSERTNNPVPPLRAPVMGPPFQPVQTNGRAGVLPTTRTNILTDQVPQDRLLSNQHACTVICPPNDDSILLGQRVGNTQIPLTHNHVEPRFFQPLTVDVSEPVYVNTFQQHAGMMPPNVTGIPPNMAAERYMIDNVLRAYSRAGHEPTLIPAIPVQQQPTARAGESSLITLVGPKSRVRASLSPQRNSRYTLNRARPNITSMRRFQPRMRMTRNVNNLIAISAPGRRPHTIPSNPSITVRAPPTMGVSVDASYDEVGLRIPNDNE